MLKHIRHTVIHHLLENYRQHSTHLQHIEAGLKKKGVQKIHFDHFAIIDLPGPHTGISPLNQLFAAIGYQVQGRDYLADKQNDFLWLTETDSFNTPATDVLPQVVVADFRLDELPLEIKKIIEKYARQAPPSPLHTLQALSGRAYLNDAQTATQLIKLITHYLTGRDWPLPTVKEFQTVHAFNELLAWVLIFGRRPNHFTVSVHLLNHFSNLEHFHQFITQEIGLPLNGEGGTIKGDKTMGIAQGSTAGTPMIVALADGTVQLPGDFVEFVWRYPSQETQQSPHRWNDFFTGFIAQHANRVIESLYHPV